MKSLGKLLWLFFSATTILLAIVSVVIDSLKIAIPISGVIIVVSVIAQIVGNAEGLNILFHLVTPRQERQSKQEVRPPQTVAQYLMNKKEHFRYEAENAFVPMTYKTVANAQLKHNTTYGTPLQMFTNHKQFVLVGLPGVGKSMVLKELFSQLADDHLNGRKVPVPLWISLNDPKNPIDAGDLFRYWWDSPEKYHLETGFDTMLTTWPPIILLDGLNEMPVNSRAKRADSLQKWIATHPHVQVIISCRTRDYQDDARLNMYISEIHVQPFEKPQIQEFVQNEAPDRAEQLIALIEKDDATFHLAQIPLHLSMLTELSLLKNQVNQLPNRLKALYEEYLQARYDREKRLKRNIHYSWGKLQDKLEKLAYKMTSTNKDSGGSTSDTEKNVRKAIGKDALDDAYNLHLLVCMNDNASNKSTKRELSRVQFFHQSLHGFFALPRLNRALKHQSARRFFRLQPRRVYSDTAAIIRQIGDLGDTAEIAVDTLIPLLGNQNQAIQTATFSALIDIGISTVNPLVKELTNENETIRNHIVKILGSIGEPAKGPLLVYALNHTTNQKVDDLIATTLVKIPDTSHNLVEALRKRSTEPEKFRGWVADALGRLKSSRAVIPLLGLLDDNDYEVRADIAWALGKIGDPTATAPLIELLKVESNQFVQLFAADAIRSIGLQAVISLIEALPDTKGKKQANIKSALTVLCKPHFAAANTMTAKISAHRASKVEIERFAKFIIRNEQAYQ